MSIGIPRPSSTTVADPSLFKTIHTFFAKPANASSTTFSIILDGLTVLIDCFLGVSFFVSFTIFLIGAFFTTDFFLAIISLLDAITTQFIKFRQPFLVSKLDPEGYSPELAEWIKYL